MNAGRIFWPRGKMLGGSSAMNAMLYVRGNKRDFDDWHAAGNAGWSWNDAIPFFKKSERNANPSGDGRFHGFEGLLEIAAYASNAGDEEVKRLLRDFFIELGYGELDDINADSFLGFVRSQGTLSHGMRNSAAKAFLHRSVVGERRNLHVIKHAHVTRLLVDGTTSKRVTGVEFVLENGAKTKLTATAEKEVIVSAGTVNSPQLLLLSGIGPAEDLLRHRIPVAVNAPGVGKNLQDHIMVPYVVSFHRSTAHVTGLSELSGTYFEYLFKRTGALSNLGSTDFMVFASTVNDPLYPDVQFLNFLFDKQATSTVESVLTSFNYNREVIDSIVVANRDAQTLLIFAVLLKPASRGSLELRSTNPFDVPKIFANYLEEMADVDTLVRALNLLDWLPATKTFGDHEGDTVAVNVTGCAHLRNGNVDAYWECYVRYMALTLYHPVGTVKMGTETDADAVVDAQLRVKGIDGLRVVDASVMPTIVSANPNAAVIMIGEKAADFIATQWVPNQTTEPLKDEL